MNVLKLESGRGREANDARPHRGRDRNRSALIAAGMDLFARKDLSAVSIDDIVGHAGLSKATFYNHFPDKTELLHAVVAHVREDQRNLILQETSDVSDPARRMARSFGIILRYRRDHPDRSDFLDLSGPPHRRVYDPINAGILEYVRDGFRTGRFILPSVEAGVLLALGMMHGCLSQADDTSTFAMIARARQLSALMLRGLGIGLAEADMIAAQEADHVFGLG